MKRSRLPVILIASPFVVFTALFLVMQLIYVTLRPPAVFDFVDSTTTTLASIGYDINSFLFIALLFVPWIGLIPILGGVVLMTKQHLDRRTYAKN